MLVTTRFILSALIATLLAGPAAAAIEPAVAQWQTVATNAGSSVELDKQRIRRLAGGKTSAWTRLTLDHPVLDFENQLRYTVVEALNHYDCAARSFVTQQRIYRLDNRVMKTEKVREPRRIDSLDDSLDARLLDEVCQPRSAGEKRQAAARAAQQASTTAAAAATRPRAMHAEMVSAADAAPPRSMKVADAPAAPPVTSATTITTAPVTGEKPRFIEMPLIDKSKAEDPYKGASPPPAAAPATAPAAAGKPAYVPSAAAPPLSAAAPAVRPKTALQPVPRTADAGALQELSRKERERQLATSGPRKATKKKPPVEETPSFEHVHWGYAGLGAPENWAKLNPANATCALGTRQSPIDIRSGIKVDLEQVRFDYRFAPFSIIDNGHSVQVNVAEGSSISVAGQTYQLMQFHFHRPSEERINGRPFDMVIHLVHKDYDNRLAVIAVLIEKGMEHPVIQTLWNNLPLEVGMEVSPPNLALDLGKLLPSRRDYYTYMGSLTTPPCSENVLWLVFKQPIQVSPEQIGIFARMYPNNARPVQPTNSRLIKESR